MQTSEIVKVLNTLKIKLDVQQDNNSIAKQAVFNDTLDVAIARFEFIESPECSQDVLKRMMGDIE